METLQGLKQIHAYLFGGLYDFARHPQQVNITKGGFQFTVVQYLEQTLEGIEKMPKDIFDSVIDKYVEINRTLSLHFPCLHIGTRRNKTNHGNAPSLVTQRKIIISH